MSAGTGGGDPPGAGGGDPPEAGGDITRLRALLAQLGRYGEAHALAALKTLKQGQKHTLFSHWPIWAHSGQLPPHDDWSVWLIRAGRGFGKTRAGAEWVSALARARPGARIALVGATLDDVRRVMVEGSAGLLAVARTGERPVWMRDKGVVRFSSGAFGFVYAASAPEGLRGPEHDAAWCDELAKWRNGDIAWDNLAMGLRRGARPQTLVTTTPRATMLMRRVMTTRALVETRGRTEDNPHLPPLFALDMRERYEGTRLGRQELDGELIDDAEGTLWPHALLEARRVAAAALPAMVRVVVGVDPPAGIGGDACGIVAVGLGADERGYVLEDASVHGASPEGWARAVADCAERHGADRVIAERNQGGEMVRSVLSAADAGMPVTLVHASRGKSARAEPVAALYERGKAWHAGVFPALEAELAGLTLGGGYQGPGRSPDRADACVWAFTALMVRPQRLATIRSLR